MIYGIYEQAGTDTWEGTGDGSLGANRILKLSLISGYWYIEEIDTSNNNNVVGTYANTQPGNAYGDPTMETWYDMDGVSLSCYEGEC